MTLKKILSFVNDLIKFANAELKKLHKEGKVEITESSYYDHIGKEAQPTYNQSGIYQSFTSEIRWRKNYKTTNRKFSPPKYLQNKVREADFFASFIDDLPDCSEPNLSEIVNNFAYHIFDNVVKSEHKYNRNFRKDESKDLLDIITNCSYKNVDLYLVNGLWTKKEINIKTDSFELSITKPPINLWLSLRTKNKMQRGFNSLLEITFYSPTPNHSFEGDYLFILLSLFGLGSVFSDYRYCFTFFDTKQYDRSRFNKYHNTYYKYEIKKSEEKKLKEFLSLYSPIIHKINGTKESPSRSHKKQLQLIFGIKVAIERYRESLLMRTHKSEKRISEAIMGLEALYNYEDKETIGFKLKVRVAKALKAFGYNSVETAKDVSKAYGIRSKYAHGAISAKVIERDFEERIINYLRLSILLFMRIDKNKDAFINLMNLSMYSDEHDKELREYVSELINKKIIKIKPDKKMFL